MGRHPKTVTTQSGLDRRSTGYYSTPEVVSNFLADVILELMPKAQSVFDPCIGAGEMVRQYLARGLSVHGMDVLEGPVPVGVSFERGDFLRFYEELRVAASCGKLIDLPYDCYVANPPYNCHEVEYIRENKSRLEAVFASVGVLNMYSMFLAALIDCAKDGALIGVLTLDSFLTATGHAGLRRYILQNCAIHHLILCPTDLFLSQGADVRTCIIILQKGTHYQRSVKSANRPLSSDGLRRVLENREFTETGLDSMVLSGPADKDEFIVGVPNEVRRMFDWQRLGERFQCVTGISTGKDSVYLSDTKREGFTVPFYKNPGTRRFYTQPDAYLIDTFLEVERSVPNFMVRNKTLLYKPGITCSSMGVPFTAAYLPVGSTYGVNANIVADEEDVWWLLGYLNTHLVTFFIRGVLNRSNMVTSGYVSRLPIAPLSKRVKEELARISRQAYAEKVTPQNSDAYVQDLNSIVNAEVGLSEGSAECLASFAANLLRAT